MNKLEKLFDQINQETHQAKVQLEQSINLWYET